MAGIVIDRQGNYDHEVYSRNHKVQVELPNRKHPLTVTVEQSRTEIVGGEWKEPVVNWPGIGSMDEATARMYAKGIQVAVKEMEFLTRLTGAGVLEYKYVYEVVAGDSIIFGEVSRRVHRVLLPPDMLEDATLYLRPLPEE